ncbi:MAG: hypothetical protein JSU96_12190 [Acidobacteriota bacterium]|nr:MAG: hypothetical protein JSU96_12190 [Acidobacteriota bacterium]
MMSKRNGSFPIRRREFLSAAICSPILFLGGGCTSEPSDLILEPSGFLGNLKQVDGEGVIPGANWFEAPDIDDGIAYRFPVGALATGRYITTDMLLDGNHMFAFLLTLQEGEKGPRFSFRWAGLNQCSFRVRLPISLLDMNRWGIEREGAFLKPRVSGERIDLSLVDRAELTVYRKSPQPARWCMKSLMVTPSEVEKISAPTLPKGPLLDEMGQSTIHEWPAKSRSLEEVVTRIKGQLEAAASQKLPDHFTRWGGWEKKRLSKGSGFFAVQKEGERWWMVDPDGYAFWSTGADCVRVDTSGRYDGIETALAWCPVGDPQFEEIFQGSDPDTRGKFVNYLTANLIRAFGSEAWHEKWGEVALAELRRLRFNTVGNWSEWEFARDAGFPYVRPLSFRPSRSKLVYRDFPDVFDPNFEADAADYANRLSDTVDDPAFIGYFLMNEPQWGFSRELPAAGMLFVTEDCFTRRELAAFLKKTYAEDGALAAAWKIPVTLDQIAGGKWTTRLTPEANADLEAFSVEMATRYFNALSSACKKVDPNHLNLGMRWAGVPPKWAVEGMKSFDVFSMNCYLDRVPRETTDEIHELLGMPVIIGEWHFGALDVGLPSSGIGHLWNQVERGKAYRVYLEDAAANPNCVGAHWFQFYDESAIGRFDGENYNIGFLDVCNRPYDELSAAGIASHEQIYEVVSGAVEPYNEVPEYLPKLY